MSEEDSASFAAASAADAVSRAKRAKAEVEYLRILRLRKFRQETVKRNRDGEYAERKPIKAAGQIVIPKPILERWGYAKDAGIEVVLLDLEWAVLIVPEHGARSLLADLQIDLSRTSTPQGES